MENEKIMLFGEYFITNVSRNLPPQNRLHRFSGGVRHIKEEDIEDSNK